jgi:hypothetical protein
VLIKPPTKDITTWHYVIIIVSSNLNGKQIVFHCQQESTLYLVGVVVASSTNTFDVTSSFFATTKTPTLQIIIWHD